MRIWDCKRVSRKFHPIFSATWRRYIYLFPVSPGLYEDDIDVDVAFVDRCFSRLGVSSTNNSSNLFLLLDRLQGKVLSYNGFAHRDSRDTGLGLSDNCQLCRAQAKLVEISSLPKVRAIAIELVGDRFLHIF